MKPWLVLVWIFLLVLVTPLFGTKIIEWQHTLAAAQAQADLGTLSTAELSEFAFNGAYVGSIGELTESDSGEKPLYVPTKGMMHALATNSEGTEYVAVARSSDGTYYATISTSEQIGSATTLEGALTAAGATSEWATENGITLPTKVS